MNRAVLAALSALSGAWLTYSIGVIALGDIPELGILAAAAWVGAAIATWRRAA